MEDPKQLQKIRMKDWWDSMKKSGHWKQYKNYEEFEARNELKKNKKHEQI